MSGTKITYSLEPSSLGGRHESLNAGILLLDLGNPLLVLAQSLNASGVSEELNLSITEEDNNLATGCCGLLLNAYHALDDINSLRTGDTRNEQGRDLS